MDKKIVIIFFTIVLVVAVVLYGDTKGWFTTYEDYMDDNNLRKGYELAGILDFVDELGYLKEDSEILVEHRAKVDEIFGETWHSNNYNKGEIAVPEVEAEETIEGELWFPAINNTAPLDEIAPTISYELMLDGYKISPYYPQNPEKYTAQALNENAFPIGFFRKVNDLCYYTVCKVEGGGYIYYFFCVNGNVDYEEAMVEAGKKLNYDDNGNLLVEESVHLFNADLADISKIDLTKEVVWRGSIYAADEIGNCDDVKKLLVKYFSAENWYDKTPVQLSENISGSFKPLIDLQDIWAENSVDDTTLSKEEMYTNLLKINETGGILQTYLMCSDGYIFANYYMNSISNTGKPLEAINGIKPTETLQLSGVSGYDKEYPIAYHYCCITGSGIREQSQEYNSFSIEILPQDNIHNLK